MFLLFYYCFFYYVSLPSDICSAIPLGLDHAETVTKNGQRGQRLFFCPNFHEHCTVYHCITVWVFTAAIVEDVLHSQHKAMKLAS